MSQTFSRTEDWLMILAMGASFATYYAWTVAFGVELSTHAEIVIKGIGRFEKTKRGVEFHAVNEFAKLLNVNIPLVKGRAA